MLEFQLTFEKKKIHFEFIFPIIGYNSPFTMENRRNEIWIQAV